MRDERDYISPFGSIVRDDSLLSRIARIFHVGRTVPVLPFQFYYQWEPSFLFLILLGLPSGI